MTGVLIRGEKERERDKREKTIWGYSGKKKKKSGHMQVKERSLRRNNLHLNLKLSSL